MQLLFATFDPEVAPVYSVPVRWVDTALLLVLAATIVASINVAGVTLFAAAIVTPPITARLITASFGRVLLLAAGIGALTRALGMWTSFQLDTASGATIVLEGAALFVVTLAATWLRRSVPAGQAPRPARVGGGARVDLVE